MKTSENSNQFIDQNVDLDRVREFLKYDPRSGNIFWIKAKNQAKPGQIAGTLHSSGYSQIKLDRVCYHAHRLAWLLFWGQASSEKIYHLDGNLQNNAIENLAMECEVKYAKANPLKLVEKSTHSPCELSQASVVSIAPVTYEELQEELIEVMTGLSKSMLQMGEIQKKMIEKFQMSS